jgi:adenine-specific DNA methylase
MAFELPHFGREQSEADGATPVGVMFTHKKQEAWESLFNSLIQAGFKISATWPVKTESEHSLHQAKKNAAAIDRHPRRARAPAECGHRLF